MDNVNNTLTAAVETYLSNPNTGVLMISGGWGTGKSYFVNRTLLPHIKVIRCEATPITKTAKHQISRRFAKLLQRGIEESSDCFLPVMVSVFGKGSVKELESAIMGEWLNVISNGGKDTVSSLFRTLKKLASKSKKLNEYFDVTSLFDYRPGTDILPKNVVVLLDDFERFDDKISETEMLGFTNKLNETLGLKVIVIANEEYLHKNKERFGVFKEKVVEKTLSYYPDVAEIAMEMVRELKDNDFVQYIESESNVRESLNPGGACSPKDKAYRKALSNLRTLKFAINHFYSVYKEAHRKMDENPDENYHEELEHIWFSILAIAIEMKCNRLTVGNLKYLETYHCVDSGLMLFNPGDPADDINPFEQLDKPLSDSSDKPQDPEANHKKWNVDYGRTFYEYYFRSRNCGLMPIASPELLHYLIEGKPFSVDEIIRFYRQEKTAQLPGGTDGDKLLDQFMRDLISMDNTEISSNLNYLLIETEKGNFSSLTAFVNSATYLFNFISLFDEEYTENDIFNSIVEGVDKWFENNAPSELETSRFQAIRSSLTSEKQERVHAMITKRLAKKQEQEYKSEINKLIALFSEYTRKFCAQICPHGFVHGSEPVGLPAFAYTPMLQLISDEKIAEKVQTMSVADAEALRVLVKERYSVQGLEKQPGESNMKQTELPFWSKLAVNLANSKNNTAGLVIAHQNLLPAVLAFIRNFNKVIKL